jgi:archaellum component FlaC
MNVNFAVCEEKLADIMNFKDKIDNEISFYSEKRKYLKKTKSDGYENIDKTKQEIVKREELLCDLVTTQTQTMTIDLDGSIPKLKMLDVSMDLISLVMPNNLSTFNLLKHLKQ